MPYNPDFIAGQNIPLPTPNSRVLSSAFGGGYIHHSRHSILFNQKRGFAFVAAHNVDGATLSSSQFTSRNFREDPNIQPGTLQVDNNRGYRQSQNGVFGPNPWDRGHLARRKSLSWGNEEEASKAELESDFWSNIAPQHKNLHDDAWGNIEDWMLKRVENSNQRACVFTGPVFTEDDPKHNNGPNEIPIRIPAGFWKVITVELNGVMRSAGFLVWQRDYDSETPLPFEPVLEQVRLTTIEVLTGLTFPSLRSFDPLLFNQQGQRRDKSISLARKTLRKEMAKSFDIALETGTELAEDLLFKATSPGTFIITDMRDIVL
ncbi:DNA/RNA non-specific endonuclease [Aquimarina spongiae]|uniref:DNA/RNA endonuclease G, NUC1 n=1 Tax=Aquimarina spongiae TaxID=570521 RepID=A0A1M6B7D6_9FLAO|nr:DNA/RNA non-specific endonuclease [Aquimarina spongiae]SHI44625.1 DNA/RNA endonuclease G, NUC1 [Aquimarina spongiae]